MVPKLDFEDIFKKRERQNNKSKKQDSDDDSEDSEDEIEVDESIQDGNLKFMFEGTPMASDQSMS